MESKNIALIGFMGSGKSVVSKRLSRIWKKEIISTDKLIEQKEDRSVTKIFKESGEPYFREMEEAIIKEVCEKKNVILDCGGGVVLSCDNIQNLKKNSILIYLRTSLMVIYERVKGKKYRPLLNGSNVKQKIKELLEKRKPLYEQADLVIDTDHKTVAQICQEIREKVIGLSRR